MAMENPHEVLEIEPSILGDATRTTGPSAGFAILCHGNLPSADSALLGTQFSKVQISRSESARLDVARMSEKCQIDC